MNDTETVAALVKAAANPLPVILKGEDGRQWLVTDGGESGQEVTDISDQRGIPLTRPLTIKAAVTLQEAESVIEYVNRYALEGTVLFADLAGSKIVAVLDYHDGTVPKDGKWPEAGEGLSGSRMDMVPGPTGHGLHTATLALPHSEEWRAWQTLNGNMIGQLEFARFIEENAPDIVRPDAAELIEMCRDIQAVRKVSFDKSVRTSSDNETFHYSDQSDATRKGELEIPTEFQIRIPVYFGEPAVDIKAYLRWRIEDNGGLKLGVKLHRLENVRQEEFKRVIGKVREGTACPVVYGLRG